MNWSVF